MNRRRIYLDHNAGAPLAEAARVAMAHAMTALGAGGNPSSIHAEGRHARDLVERARDLVAALAGVRRERVVFTAGGSEADALGVIGLARAARAAGAPARVIGARTEHPAVTGTLGRLGEDGFTVAWIPVDSEGRWDLAELDRALAGGAALVTIAAVNHELGTCNPVVEVAARAHAAGARVHVDAVQAAGRLPLAPLAGVADALALSGHKLGGPAGVGALIVADDLAMAAPWGGGPQERERRPGTENVVGIAGFGAVAALADPAGWAAVTALGERLEAGVRALGARIHGAGAPRVGGTINLAFAGARGDAVVIGLDLVGIAAATGAACSSGSLAPSPVLVALGLDELRAREGVRLSLGRTTTRDEIDAVLTAMPAIVARARG